MWHPDELIINPSNFWINVPNFMDGLHQLYMSMFSLSFIDVLVHLVDRLVLKTRCFRIELWGTHGTLTYQPTALLAFCPSDWPQFTHLPSVYEVYYLTWGFCSQSFKSLYKLYVLYGTYHFLWRYDRFNHQEMWMICCIFWLRASTLPDVLSFPRFCTGLAWKLAKETQKPPEVLLPQRLKNGHLSRIETDVW